MKHSSTCLANRHDRSRDDECTCGAVRDALIAKAFTPASRADAETCSMEDLEAASTMLDRVMAGLCQSCGKKEGCTCRFVDPKNPLGIVIGFQNA